MRTLASHLLALGVAVVAVRATAESVTSFPPPLPSPGAVVAGTVRLPNGSLAGLNRSMLERFTALLVHEAEALTSTNVRNVGRNVGVQLLLRRGDGAVQALDTSFTNDQGQFLMYLPSGTSEDTCRFILSVGSAQTLTRAFVYRTTEPIIVDYASETAVALILGQVQQGADLCGFSAGEIRSLVNCIRNLPGDVTGANVFETNRNALLLTGNASGQSGEQCLGATPVAAVTPTRTPTPFAVCTPPPCKPGEVFSCPGSCPGGCGTRCATPTKSPTITPTPRPPLCLGDCNGDGAVTVNELVTAVNIALEAAPSTACPAVQCLFEDPPVVFVNCLVSAVNNLLTGCPTAPPTLSLSVHTTRNPDTQSLQVVADLQNSGEVPVSYLTGCSAQCRPKFYRAISFQLIGPHGTEVIVEDPCGGVLLCAEFRRMISPGESLEQTLDLTGTEFIRDATPTTGIGACGSCSQAPLEHGRYKVTARFQYSTDLNNPWPFPDYVEASAEFDWP